MVIGILGNHDLPLVFLSSPTEKEVIEKTEDITSYGYVVKNSGETVLVASIKMAFRLFDAHIGNQCQKMEIDAAYEEMRASNEVLMQTQGELIERERALDESETGLRRAELASKSGNRELHLDSPTIIGSEGAKIIYGISADEFTYTIVTDGTIFRQVAYWPEDYPAPGNRRHLVELTE